MTTGKIDQQTQVILDNFYCYLSEKNAESMATLFSDTLEWYLPKEGKLAWTVKKNEKAEIIRILKFLFDSHQDGEDQLKRDQVFVDGNQITVFGSISGKVKKTGMRFSMEFYQKFTIEYGIITKIIMMESYA